MERTRKKITLKNVLHVPKLKKILFLISKVIKHGFNVQFDINRCFVRTMENKEIAKGTRDRNLYIVNCKRINGVKVAEFLSNKCKVDILHQRQGRLNVNNTKKL